MGELRGISGKEVVKRLQKVGYQILRQRGSHVRLRHFDSISHKPVVVPMHKEIKIGLLLQIIKDAGIDVDKFKSL